MKRWRKLTVQYYRLYHSPWAQVGTSECNPTLQAILLLALWLLPSELT